MSADAVSSPQQSADAAASLQSKFKGLRGWLEEFDGQDGGGSQASPQNRPRSPVIKETYIWRSDSLSSLSSNDRAMSSRSVNSLNSQADKENARHGVRIKRTNVRAKAFINHKAMPALSSQPSKLSNDKSQSRGRRRHRTTCHGVDNLSKPITFPLSSKVIESSESTKTHVSTQEITLNIDSEDHSESVNTNDCVEHHGKTWSALDGASASKCSWQGNSSPVDKLEPISIVNWRKDIHGDCGMPNLSIGKLGGVAHCCDIDTNTGAFMNPVLHPETHQCPEQLDDAQMAWRRDNMTSELEIVQEIRRREKLASRLASMSNSAVPYQTIEENAWPKADCFLRPVHESDLTEIASILNTERHNLSCPQIFGSRPISFLELKAVLEASADRKQPFILAAISDDPLLDQSKWPADSKAAYEQYVRYKSQVDPNPRKKIVGVALVVRFDLGFFGTWSPATRHSGMLRVVVHPQYRRQKIGSALLDRLLVSTALFHRSQVDYNWRCSNRNGIYEHPVTRNIRQYARLYIEVWCESSNSAELAWRTKMLSKFGFSQAAYLTGAGKSVHSQGAKWQDLSLWELQVQPCQDMVDSTR